ncbi:hypothetical protein C1645_761443, partial [Glomus cerebriforme]
MFRIIARRIPFQKTKPMQLKAKFHDSADSNNLNGFINSNNTNGSNKSNGTRDTQLIKGVNNDSLLKGIGLLLTAVGMTATGTYSISRTIRVEIQEGLKPTEVWIGKLEDRFGRLEEKFYEFAEDIGSIKALLGYNPKTKKDAKDENSEPKN